MDSEESYRYDLEKQTECYNTLITEGGRPSHPVSLGRDILENPGEHHKILSYWQLVNNDAEGRDWEVFEPQVRRLRDFHKWQRNNRAEGRFRIYTERVKGGLAEHGFTRPFQLDEDPKRQDKLMTWIEYLYYEYWWYNKSMRFVKRHQLRYDEAWRKLVGLKVLKPSETEEFIWNIDSSFRHAGEEDQAERAVESAKSAVISTQKAITDQRRSGTSLEAARAQSCLDGAVKSLESIKRRNNLVSEFRKKTKNYRISKENAERRSILLRWILEQVPLIELELGPAESAEIDSNGRNDGKQRSKRNRPDDFSEQQVSKRQRQDGESNSTSDLRTRTSTAKECKSPLKRNCHDPLNEGRAYTRPKRNVQNPCLSPHETSGAPNPTPTGDPCCCQIPVPQNSRVTAPRSVKASSIRCSAPKKTRSEAEAETNGILDGKARVMKGGRRGGKSNNLSALCSPPRRSIRKRRPRKRLQ
ncbi:hypothetical protein DL95DRAFT_389417 [Leptodontidium sp. 2 PMI_412]|nr:hypothetical protein DL95DRAFT_389417 [Leptodontidium sp. 2 PMI_412]